jgi:hypothetical protein
MAAALGVHHATVNRWSAGTNVPLSGAEAAEYLEEKNGLEHLFHFKGRRKGTATRGVRGIQASARAFRKSRG